MASLRLAEGRFVTGDKSAVLAAQALLKAKSLIEFGQFVERLMTRPFHLAPVGKNIFGPHSSVRANFAVWDFLLVKKLHEMRPRDIEQVSRLLRRQFGFVFLFLIYLLSRFSL